MSDTPMTPEACRVVYKWDWDCGQTYYVVWQSNVTGTCYRGESPSPMGASAQALLRMWVAEGCDNDSDVVAEGVCS